MHKFKAKNKNKLDNPKRREILPPKETLERLGLMAEDTMADVGCGIGYFTLPAAKIINKENKIYALDILDEMLDEVKNKSKELKLENIVAVKTAEYDLKLEDKSVSFVIMVNVLHEIEDKIRILKEIHRILKPGGRIAVIDFEKKETEMGPPVDHRLSREETLSLLESAEFEMLNAIEISDTFYGLVAVKQYKRRLE